MDEQSFYTDDFMDNIIKKYTDMVYRLACSQVRNQNDADDVFQEVFFRYIRKNQKFDSEEHRKAWLIRVTLNCCKNIYSSAWAKNTVPLEDNFIFEDKEDVVFDNELKKLPMKYRTVIHLFYYEDMSIDDICKVLKQKPSTIKMRLSRAKEKLKNILGDEYND